MAVVTANIKVGNSFVGSAVDNFETGGVKMMPTKEISTQTGLRFGLAWI